MGGWFLVNDHTRFNMSGMGKGWVCGVKFGIL